VDFICNRSSYVCYGRTSIYREGRSSIYLKPRILPLTMMFVASIIQRDFFGRVGYLGSRNLCIDLFGPVLPPPLGGFRRRPFVLCQASVQ